MKKTMVYLSEETHEGLKRLALEMRVSLAELVRRALEQVYGEDLEDLRDMEQELANYRAHPESAMSYGEYRRQRLGNVQA